MTACSFNVKSREPFKRHSQCRECMAQSSRRHYEHNRDTVKQRSRSSTDAAAIRNRQWLAAFLADKHCADCDEQAPDIFEFDHRHGRKRSSVSRMVHQGLALSTIKAEIAKCDILCPNCHRRRTHEDIGSYLHRFATNQLVQLVDIEAWESPSGSRNERVIRAAMRGRVRAMMDNIAYLQVHPCVDCSEDDILVLEYDHVRGQKLGEVTTMIQKGRTLQAIATERAKCDVRCANCHRRRSGNVRPLAA
jgi:hypothetical protein